MMSTLGGMGYSLAGNKLSESKKMTRIEVSKSPTVIMADVINERHPAENECLALKERAVPINSTRMHSGRRTPRHARSAPQSET